jgi:prophage antirepressor-like protein
MSTRVAESTQRLPFGGVGITVRIDIGGDTWFAAKDICKALKYANQRSALSRHVDPANVSHGDVPTAGGIQKVALLNQAGVNSLILGSKKQEANDLKQWIESTDFHMAITLDQDEAPSQSRASELLLASDPESRLGSRLQPNDSHPDSAEGSVQSIEVAPSGSRMSMPFEGMGITVFLDNNDEVWFSASEVCRVLGYVKTWNAVAQHVEPEDTIKRSVPTKGGVQSLSFVNEAGIYALIFGSQLPEAKRLKKWVFSEVLPSIRKTGSYGQPRIDWDDPNFVSELLAQSTARVAELKKLAE